MATVLRRTDADQAQKMMQAPLPYSSWSEFPEESFIGGARYAHYLMGIMFIFSKASGGPAGVRNARPSCIASKHNRERARTRATPMPGF